MRRARTRRRAAPVAVALAFAAAVPLLGGCGIQETDVIEAGGPASFQAFLDRDYDMLLFFRSPDGGLSAVIRRTEPPVESGDGNSEFGDGYTESGSGDQSLGDTARPVPTEKVVLALLAGPRKEDRAAGLSTSLPAARPGATVEVDLSPDGKVTTRLPLALEGLSGTALRQLTCTIAYSQDADGQVTVELTGQDGASRSGTCGLAPGSTENAPAEPEVRARTTPTVTSG
ncbi:hypothetical protein [Streptomyces sp. AS02]|uniref:hypothetical protein n=1 Tax=Streptomyces sp. AS02 TaxID=2938946 RepID=UPI0020222D2F|nr:hypothetical protein [Streptomyces sp. AS02]MCL8010894.1 hypothetical protein [Streptomyces sp. AS02]